MWDGRNLITGRPHTIVQVPCFQNFLLPSALLRCRRWWRRRRNSRYCHRCRLRFRALRSFRTCLLLAAEYETAQRNCYCYSYQSLHLSPLFSPLKGANVWFSLDWLGLIRVIFFLCKRNYSYDLMNSRNRFGASSGASASPLQVYQHLAQAGGWTNSFLKSV